MNYKNIISLLLIISFPLLLIAQPIEEQTILLASDGQADDMFGSSMAISGNFSVIGTPQDDDVDNNAGAAYIYEKISGNWTFSQKITANDGELADMFGTSVDIDGDYIVIGSYQAVGITGNTGAAYIYKKNGSNWEFQQKIFADDGLSADNFGKSIAISGDYIVAGADNEDYGTGAAYVFHLSGETWTQVAKLEGEDVMNEYFAHSLDIDNNYIVIGAWQNNAPLSNTGAAFVFYNNSGNWEFQYKLVADDAQADDAYIVAGAFGVSGSQGAAYVFVRDNTTWLQHAKLTASDGDGEDYFGKSVSISGNYVLVGSQRHDMVKSEEGAAYLYIRDGLNWNESQFTASDASDTGVFGYCVTIEDDYAFISSVQENGAVYVFAPVGANINTLNNNINIYPNPANNIINFSNIDNIVYIKIIDLTGKIIIEDSSGNNKINLSELNSGIYFIKINTNNGIYSSKIIKD